jgi:nitrite reductase/ring-hydroxylating ferredoxin subunit
MDQATPYRPDRHPSESYEDILDRDTRPVPDCLRQGATRDLGDDGIPVTNYFDPDHFAREVRHVWLKVWQWACREEDIPEAGDVFLYEIVGRSVIVARQTDGSIKAFYNSCLHRGRKLVDTAGNKPHFWCKYHGMSWTCAGKMRANPIAWDFPQFERRDTSLPELKVSCWGGFVFITAGNSRSASGTFRALRPGRPLSRRAHLQDRALQLEGDGGGLHGKPPYRRHASANRSLPGRRQQPVRYSVRPRHAPVHCRRGAQPDVGCA